MNEIINRKSVLTEILNIERKITTMKRNPRYVQIKSSIFSLESRRFGNHLVYISAPDDAETTLEFSKHSKEMKDTISRYKELRTEFDDQLNELITQKAMLQIQLFKRPN